MSKKRFKPYPPATIAEDSFGNLCIWEGVVSVTKINPFYLKSVEGKEADLYIQEDQEGIFSHLPKPTVKLIKNGIPIVTHFFPDDYFLNY